MRRFLIFVPKAAAVVTLVLFAGRLQALIVVAIVAGSYVGSAVIFAALDLIVTSSVPRFQQRRRDRLIERSIRLHPAQAHLRKPTPRFKRQGAAA
jgi:hypothetical protein